MEDKEERGKNKKEREKEGEGEKVTEKICVVSMIVIIHLFIF
jgi:hypothetical protein